MKTESIYRGNLSKEVQDISRKRIGREISLRELRLLPYLYHVMINARELDPMKITGEERGILQRLKSEGHLAGGMTGLSMTKEFWDYIGEVLWLSYVAYDKQDGMINCLTQQSDTAS